MRLWPLVWGFIFPKVKILKGPTDWFFNGGISERSVPKEPSVVWMFGTHRESLMHVEFLYQACRRGSQDRSLSQEMAIVTAFYGPLLAPWLFCDFQARSRVTPGVWCHSSNPAKPSLSSSSPSPNHFSSFPSIPCLVSGWKLHSHHK